MAGTGVIDAEIINLEFWSSWPRRFYNVRTYDSTREDFELGMPSTDLDNEMGDSDKITPLPAEDWSRKKV